MKKIALLIIILTCFSTFSLDSVYAQSELELWCLAAATASGVGTSGTEIHQSRIAIPMMTQINPNASQ